MSNKADNGGEAPMGKIFVFVVGVILILVVSIVIAMIITGYFGLL